MCMICPKCGAIAEYNAYYERITCTRCSWESEKKIGGNRMQIDLPQCSFKHCKFQADGNCTSKSEYDKCEYIKMSGAIKAMIMTFNLCSLCQNTECQNSGHEEYGCVPVWNGHMI